jgi:hypothetical protein
MARFRAPVKRGRDGIVLRLEPDERALLRRLLGELRALLLGADDADEARPAGAEQLVQRLFPTAHPDDPELEAEYQRLMRDELVASRVAALDVVDEVLAEDRPMDEGQARAFMQSINAVRLVLGTMLGVTDDPSADEDGVPGEHADSPEYHLYAYLSWLLEWTVRAQR